MQPSLFLYSLQLNEKSRKFNVIFENLISEYEKIPHTLKNLIKIDTALHKNYAFNFWLWAFSGY